MLKISVKLPPHFCGDSRPAAYKIPQDRKMSDYFKLLANPMPLKCFFDISVDFQLGNGSSCAHGISFIAFAMYV